MAGTKLVSLHYTLFFFKVLNQGLPVFVISEQELIAFTINIMVKIINFQAWSTTLYYPLTHNGEAILASGDANIQLMGICQEA